MPVYHVVLFKVKPGVTAEQLTEWAKKGAAMVGQIPGLLKWNSNPPLEVTKHRGKGYDFGLVAVLEKAEDVATYGDHPAHLEVHALREALCDDTLAYDMEF